MNDSITLKNNLLLLENALVNGLSQKLNLFLNEFSIIKLFSTKIKNKREINFDTKKNNNIYQINTFFDDEKENLIKQFNDDFNKLGYLTKYNLINRDDIDKIVQKRISLLIHTKLTDLVSDSFASAEINKIINIINTIIENTQISIDVRTFPEYDNSKFISNDKNAFRYIFNNQSESNEISIDFYCNNKSLEFAKLTKYPDNFFVDIDINLNNVFIYVFNKTSNKEIIQYPLTEKERKSLLSKKGIKPL